MEKNMGSADRIIRLGVAILIAALYFMNAISGSFAWVAVLVAIILGITSLIGFCPLYVPLKINTRKQGNKK